MRAKFGLAFGIAFLSAVPAVAADYALVMVEQPGCIYCQRWDEEIAPAYPKTAEGAFAPLRRVDISAVEESVTPQRAVIFTPTFLLVEDDVELGRLEGYPGAEFFWPMLDTLLHDKIDFEDPTE